jgi:hypothetical protein
LDLEILVEGDKALFNPYGVIAVNPDKGPQIHADLADQFINWIISVPVQEKIAAFGEEDFGQSLFIPDSAAWREQQSAAEGSAGLKITGMVGAEATLTEDDLRAMESMQVESTSKSGEKTMNDGVLMRTLLEQAAPAAGAATVVFVASDGFTSEAPLPDVLACEDCIVAFRENGGFNTVMPGFSGKLQVKDLVEIQLK